MPRDGKTTSSTDKAVQGHPYDVAFLDVHLNDRVVVANVPEAAWKFSIGGTKVLKKWLAYREKEVLGRNLSIDEVRHFTGMVRRLAAILQMGGELDQVYQQAKDDAWPPVKKEAPLGVKTKR